MAEYEKLPYITPSDNIGNEFYLVRVGRGQTKFGTKTFVEVAPEAGQAAVATLSFGANAARDADLDKMREGDRFTLESIDTGKPKPFVKVVRL